MIPRITGDFPQRRRLSAAGSSAAPRAPA